MRRAEGISNATINRELMRLKRAFHMARATTPPKVTRLPTFPRLTEASPRAGFFEYPDFVTLRSELPEQVKPVITFAYSTGCRKGEILGLRWDQVDLIAKVVRLNPGEAMNDEGRVIPLVGEVFQILVMQKQIRDQTRPECRWEFSRYGQRIKDFRAAWEGASKRAGVPERVVMAIGGWKTRSVFDRYNIVSERDLHEAAAKLETYPARIENSSGKDKTSTKLPSPDFAARKLWN